MVLRRAASAAATRPAAAGSAAWPARFQSTWRGATSPATAPRSLAAASARSRRAHRSRRVRSTSAGGRWRSRRSRAACSAPSAAWPVRAGSSAAAAVASLARVPLGHAAPGPGPGRGHGVGPGCGRRPPPAGRGGGHRPGPRDQAGQAARRPAAGGVERQGQGDGHQLVLGLGPELTVAGRERLVLDGAVHQELLHQGGALDRAPGAVDGPDGGPDGVLLEDETGDVLGPVDVTLPVIGGHDHPRRAVPARQPTAVVVGHGAVPVVGHVLAEVPD